MEQLAPLAAMVVFAYALGTVWYHVFKRPKQQWLQVMAYPLLGIIVGEGIWVKYFMAGPTFLQVHVAVALVATFVAVVVEHVVESKDLGFLWRDMQHLRFTVNGKQHHEGRRTPAGVGAQSEN